MLVKFLKNIGLYHHEIILTINYRSFYFLKVDVCSVQYLVMDLILRTVPVLQSHLVLILLIMIATFLLAFLVGPVFYSKDLFIQCAEIFKLASRQALFYV